MTGHGKPNSSTLSRTTKKPTTKHDRTGYDEPWLASEPRAIQEVDAGT
jgi:hypothetical protein